MPENNGIKKVKTTYSLEDVGIFLEVVKTEGYSAKRQDHNLFLDDATGETHGHIDFSRKLGILSIYHKDPRTRLETLTDELYKGERTLEVQIPSQG